MTQRIQAIETSYKGYRFRSRLEARWAVFFDALDIKWQYEVQGYEKGGYCYLPDFYLPASQLWVEVKGTDEALRAEAGLGEFLDYGCPLPHFDDSIDTDGQKRWPPSHPYPIPDETGRTPEAQLAVWRAHENGRAPRLHGLLFLSEIPDPTRFGMHLHPLLQHHKGLQWGLVYFGPIDWHPGYHPVRFNGGELAPLLLDASVLPDEREEGPDWPTDSCRVRSEFIPTRTYWTKVLDAYRAARSARFEHGETPR